MAALTPSRIHAIFSPDPRLKIDTENTDVQQHGPVPGMVNPQQAGDRLIQTYEPADDGLSFDIVIAGGGGGSTYYYRPNASSTLYGHDGYQIHTGTEAVESGADAGGRARSQPHLLATDGGLYACWTLNDQNSTIGIAKRDDSTGTWSILHTENVIGGVISPSLVQIGSRLYCFYVVEDFTAGTHRADALISMDAGVTWDTYVTDVLPPWVDSDDGEILKARFAASGNDIVAAVSYETPATDPRIQVYSSSDCGLTFSESGAILVGRGAEITAIPGGFYMVWGDGTGLSRVYGSSLPAGILQPSATRTLATDAIFNPDNQTVCTDDQGRLLVYYDGGNAVNPQSAAGRVIASEDGGSTWDYLSSDLFNLTRSRWYASSTDVPSPQDIYATHYCGAVCMVSRMGVAATENPIYMDIFGGWTTVTSHTVADAVRQRSQITPAVSYWGSSVTPNGSDWSGNPGTGTFTDNEDGSTNLSGTDTYTADVTTGTGPDEGAFLRAKLTCNSGDARVSIRINDGGTADRCSIWSRDDGTFVVSGAVNTGVTPSVDATQPHEILLVMRGGTYSAWVRQAPTSGNLLHDGWEQIADGLAVGTLGPVAFDTQFQFEVDGGDADFFYVEGYPYGGQPTWEVDPNLIGKRAAASPQKMPNGAELGFATTGKPVAGDVYEILPDYEYRIQRVDGCAHRSPRIAWRTDDTADDPVIVWTRDVAADACMGTDAFGAVLMGLNFGSVVIEALIASVWAPLDTVSLAEFTGGSYVRTGDCIKPDSAGASRYYRYNELAGWAFKTATDCYRIVGNTEGYWSTDAKQVTLYLDPADVDPGDPTSGSDGELYATDALIWFNDPAISSTFESIRFTLQDPLCDTFYQASIVQPMRLTGIGFLDSYGTQYTTTYNAEVETTRGGSRCVAYYGPERRATQISWSDGICLELDQLDDYVTGGTHVLSGYRDVAEVIRGYTQNGYESGCPVAFTECLPTAEASGAQTMLGRNKWLWGMFDNQSLAVDEVVEDNDCDGCQVIRITNVNFSEEI